MAGRPFVSVVTPFHNTAPYLQECITAVLGQTHRDLEYVLVNNRSTDGSREIAARYAARDRRIRLIDNEQFLKQVPNFNHALESVSPEARYVKMALADDLLFPECLERMVDLAEREPSVAIVSSYRLWGEDHPEDVGLSFRVSRVPGREACRMILVDRRPLTGSQNTVMYRADVVRVRRPFFDPARPFADTDAAIEILLKHDLGFVHQILSFTRTENQSLFTSALHYDPMALQHHLAVEIYGEEILVGEELAGVRREARSSYFRSLGTQCLRLPGRGFWDYHRAGLAPIGRTVGWLEVLPWTLAEGLRLILNPEATLRRAARAVRRRWRYGLTPGGGAQRKTNETRIDS